MRILIPRYSSCESRGTGCCVIIIEGIYDRRIAGYIACVVYLITSPKRKSSELPATTLRDTIQMDAAAMAEETPVKLECDYSTGMFGHDPAVRKFDSLEAHLVEISLVEIHEAGHAVMQYALGFGCTGITLTIEIFLREGEQTIGYTGKCFPKKDRNRRLARRFFEQGILDDSAIAYGVSLTAGPAAERKFRLRNRLPLDLLRSTRGDHEAVERVAKSLHQKGGHDRFGYQDDVWRRAQLGMENETIWNAVEQLGGELKNWWPLEEGTGTFTSTLPGPQARAIMRQSGIVPGMLGYRTV